MNPEAAYQAQAEQDAARRSRELAVAEMRSVLDALTVAERERDQARRALRLADDLLRRLAEWDMLFVPDDGRRVPTADAPYWQREIAKARAALAGNKP